VDERMDGWKNGGIKRQERKIVDPSTKYKQMDV
jgi:hypothetical protein